MTTKTLSLKWIKRRTINQCNNQKRSSVHWDASSDRLNEAQVIYNTIELHWIVPRWPSKKGQLKRHEKLESRTRRLNFLHERRFEIRKFLLHFVEISVVGRRAERRVAVDGNRLRLSRRQLTTQHRRSRRRGNDVRRERFYDGANSFRAADLLRVVADGLWKLTAVVL